MVIGSSDVSMRSGRAYQRQKRDSSSVQGWGEVLNAATSPTAKESRSITQKETSEQILELYQNYSSGGQLVRSEGMRTEREEVSELSSTEVSQITTVDGENAVQLTTKDAVTDSLFVRVFTADGQVSGAPLTLRELLSILIRQRREMFEKFMEHFRIGMLMGGKKLSIEYTRIESSEEQTESEHTEVSSDGRVITADGREIDFSLSLGLSRSFSERNDQMGEAVSVRLHDPLVVNFSQPSASLKDETFRFDIDADGELDNISLLGEACGYLALDINEDGIIGDGSELFGTKSGDGFADLRVYDTDGNGWIDENDPVFDKLKIWSKDSLGNDHLVGLTLRGIGAIFLGSTPSEFSLKNDTNETLGVIRSTGVFLREDGTAGTIQQIDVADRQSA